MANSFILPSIPPPSVADELDVKRILKAFKKNFSCNGAITTDEEIGQVGREGKKGRRERREEGEREGGRGDSALNSYTTVVLLDLSLFPSFSLFPSLLPYLLPPFLPSSLSRSSSFRATSART